MRFKRKILILTLLLVASAPALADIEVILATETDSTSSLSPSKSSNSSSKFSNSISKFSNSSSKFSNSSSSFDNSPSKSGNDKSGDRRLLLKKGDSYVFIGYYVVGDEGIINFFSPSGDRLFYSPPETESVFDGKSGAFAGTLDNIKGNDVLVVNEQGQLALVKSGISLSDKSSSPNTPSTESHQIEHAHNDKLFVINGQKFGAKTYCLGWSEGESVIFIDGGTYGACKSAELFNLDRKESCEVWCE